MPIRLRTLVLASLLPLGGCAAVNYEPVTLDTPPPQVSGTPVNMGPHCTAELRAGAACMALVRAQDWYSDTGVRVKEGQAYCIRVPPGQVWFDAQRRNSPPDGEPGSLLMNVFKWLKRHDQPWFTLMADVAQEGAAKDIASWPALQSHSVAQHRKLDVKASGALVLYPNDARNLFSSDDQYFYRNNRGQIWVQLAHLQPGQPCNDTLTP